jgi:hypothetical protein
MGTDARGLARLKVAAVTLLTGVAALMPATEALARTAERRVTDGICNPGTPRERRCTISVKDRAPAALRLSVPKTCRTENVLATTVAGSPKQVRYIALRLDGETIATTTRERPFWIGLGIDCAGLAVGEHVLTATLRRRDGTTLKVTRTLTRLPGVTPDPLLARTAPL